MFLCPEDASETLGIKGAALQSLAVTCRPGFGKRRQERTSVVLLQKAAAQGPGDGAGGKRREGGGASEHRAGGRDQFRDEEKHKYVV